MLVDAKDREDYEHAKQAIMRCLGPTGSRKLEQVAVCRWPRDESIANVWEESVQHVRSFLSGNESAEEIGYKWMFTRTLAKCKRECADSTTKDSS